MSVILVLFPVLDHFPKYSFLTPSIFLCLKVLGIQLCNKHVIWLTCQQKFPEPLLGSSHQMLWLENWLGVLLEMSSSHRRSCLWMSCPRWSRVCAACRAHISWTHVPQLQLLPSSDSIQCHGLSLWQGALTAGTALQEPGRAFAVPCSTLFSQRNSHFSISFRV